MNCFNSASSYIGTNSLGMKIREKPPQRKGIKEGEASLTFCFYTLLPRGYKKWKGQQR